MYTNPAPDLRIAVGTCFDDNYMHISRVITLLFLTALMACNQASEKPPQRDPEAKALNDSAFKILMKSTNDSDYQKAIGLLDKAIAIDSTYVGAYRKKVSLETLLKQYDKALATSKKLNELRPANPNFMLTTGILYEKNGDTISSVNYFQKALPLYDKTLDTMSLKNPDRFALTMNKGITFILLNEPGKGNDILKALYDKQTDLKYKEYLIPLMNKPRKNVVDYLTLEQK